MALPVSIPNTFANATASIPLSQLDSNFSTLSNAINGLNSGSETLANLKASNANISGGTVTVTFASLANGNAASPSLRFTEDTDTGIYNSGANAVSFTEGGTGYRIGFRNVPAVGTKTGAYTLATSDVGEYVQIGSGGQIDIPDGTFAEGDIISLFNNTNAAVTVNCAITTAYIAGTDADKANVSLATRGVATVLFISNTVCVISGNVS
jgi:hypothetical protein